MAISIPVQTLTLTRTVPAPPAKVYATFTDSDLVSYWLCDDANLNAIVGGHVLFIWSNPAHHVFGTFTVLEQDKRVIFTWRGKNDTVQSTVDVTLEEKDNQTYVTINHSDFADDADINEYKKEWDTALNNLVAMFETGADLRITDRVIIGIYPSALTDEQAKITGLAKGEGVAVNGVIPGYSAEAAGIQRGDVIIAVNGNKITDEAPIFNFTSNKKPGDVVEVTYYRGQEKHTVKVALKGYPVPPMPADFVELGDRVQKTYDDLFSRLAELFNHVTDEQASAKPAPTEWSANEVIAHLILTERNYQDFLGSFMQGAQGDRYSANTPARIASITNSYSTKNTILAEFKRSLNETSSLLRNVPEEHARKSFLWWANFEIDGSRLHTEGHFDQIRNALEVAKK